MKLTLILLILAFINLFYLLIKSLLLATECVLKPQDLQSIDLKVNNFHSLEVTGRGSETQLQVGKNLYKLP